MVQKYSNKYLPSFLYFSDKKKQKRSLNKSRKDYRTKRGKKKYYTRPKVKSYKSKPSSWTQKFHKLHPKAKSLKQIECHPDMCKYINCHYHVMNVMEESGKIFFHASSFTKPNDLYVIEIDKSQHSLLRHHPLEFMESTKYRKKKQFDFCEEVVYLQNNIFQD